MLFFNFWNRLFGLKKDKKISKIFSVMDEIKEEVTGEENKKLSTPELFDNICKSCKDSAASVIALSNKLSDQFVVFQKNKNAFDELVNEMFANQDKLNKMVSDVSAKWVTAITDIIKLKTVTRALIAKKQQLFNEFPVKLGIVNDISATTPIDDPGYFAEIQRRKSIKDGTWKILNTTVLQSGAIEVLMFKDGKTIKTILAKNFIDNPKISEILSMCTNFNKRFPAKYLLSGKLTNDEKNAIAAGILFLKKKISFAMSYFIPQLESELETVAEFEKFVANEMLVDFSVYIR